MTQEKEWDREYSNSKLLVKENIPSRDIVRFVKFLKKEFKKSADNESAQDFESLNVLDLGSGMGRNSFYFAELGAKVLGLEISGVAVDIARKNLAEAEKISGTKLDVEYKKQSIGEKFPCEADWADIALDIVSSNSLTEAEREVYLSETFRVLKSGGYFLVKALCKDADLNARHLLKNNPGKETDTYILPGLNITERVWSGEDFLATYGKFFTILKLEKITRYTRMNDRSYKRNFWIAYLRK